MGFLASPGVIPVYVGIFSYSGALRVSIVSDERLVAHPRDFCDAVAAELEALRKATQAAV